MDNTEREEKTVENTELTASEALTGFLAWLTSLETPVTFSAHHDASIAPSLIKDFEAVNNIGAVRDEIWPNFIMPKTRRLFGSCSGESETETVPDIRLDICRIISRMLDNPDQHGIYPTGQCFDDLENYINELLSKARGQQ